MSLDAFIKDTRSPLVRLLGQSPVPHKPVAFGGRFEGTALALRALPGDAHERAVADAAKHLVSIGFQREDLYTEIGEGLFALECKVQLLARALLVLGGKEPEPLCASADELRAALEPDEVSGLFEHFLAWQEERSPLTTARSWEEVEAFLLALGKGLAPQSALSSYDTGTLRFMLREVAARWTPPTKPLSSGISPASDSSTTSTP